MKRFLSFLIRLYPERVRREHGKEMRQLLSDMECDEGGIRFATACRLTWDTLRMLPASHVHELSAVPQLVTGHGIREASFFMMKWIVLGFLALALLFWLLLFTVESYVPFAPYIDTQFAPGFSLETYEQVKPGMMDSEVAALIGDPRRYFQFWNDYIPIENKGMVYASCWVYSDDNAFPLWDFAWIRIEVCFDEERRVITKREFIQYD
jgi:hypothetical protein